MATNGTITGQFANGQYSSYFTYRCDWEVVSQSTANRTSTVQLKWVVTKKDASFYTNKASTPWTQVVNGASTSGNLNFNIGSYGVNVDYIVRTDTVTIQHGNDGIGVANISGTLDLSGTTAGTASLSGAATLPTIATTPPTINSFTVTDGSGAQSTVGAWVGGKSTPTMSCSATGNNGASISQYSWYINGTLYATTTSNSYAATVALNAGSNTLKVVVTDSYGNTSERSTTITASAYSLPTVTASAFRCDSSGTEAADGAYVKATATFTHASIGSNSASCSVSCNSGSATISTSGGSATFYAGLLPANAYSVTFTVTDSLGGTATYVEILYVADGDPLTIHPEGGVGIGMMAAKDRFDVNYTSVFHEDTEVDANLFINQGLYAYGGLYLMNGARFASGSWTPTIIAGGTGFTKTDISATYYKLGPIVMINFLVWDMAITGGNSSVVCVSLPFTPASLRNYGVVGFNGTGLNELHASATAGSKYFTICYRQSNGYQVAVTGTDAGGAIGTFQFQMWYFTND